MIEIVFRGETQTGWVLFPALSSFRSLHIMKLLFVAKPIIHDYFSSVKTMSLKMTSMAGPP